MKKLKINLYFLLANVNAIKCYMCFSLKTDPTYCKENVANEAHLMNCDHIFDELSFESVNIFYKNQNFTIRNKEIAEEEFTGCVTLFANGKSFFK